MAPSSLVGGTWAGWSCAYSVSGVPLQVPADLCTPRRSAAGFRELTTEIYLELQAPATGAFVERRVTKLMPNDALPVQTKAGRLAQLHVKYTQSDSCTLHMHPRHNMHNHGVWCGGPGGGGGPGGPCGVGCLGGVRV